LRSRAGSDPTVDGVRELCDAAPQEAALGLGSGELEGAFVRDPCLIGAAETAQEVGPCRVEVLVAVEVEPIDEFEPRADDLENEEELLEEDTSKGQYFDDASDDSVRLYLREIGKIPLLSGDHDSPPVSDRKAPTSVPA